MSQQLLNTETPAEEPLVTRASVMSAGTAVLSLLVAFAVPVTQTQQVAILGVVAVVAPFLVALWARRSVFSPAKVKAMLAGRPPRD